MTESAIQPGRMAMGVALCLSAALVLLLMASNPGSVSDDRVEASPQAAPPAVPIEAGALPGSPAEESPRADLTTRSTQHRRGVTALDQVTARARQHGRSFDRFEAIVTLGESRDEAAELTLTGLLSDPDPQIREAAVESLAAMGASSRLGYALVDNNPLVRETAIELLAEIGTRDALDALSITLDDPDPDLRLAAVYELADSDSPAAAALLQRFLSDTDPLVRDAAFESVANCCRSL